MPSDLVLRLMIVKEVAALIDRLCRAFLHVHWLARPSLSLLLLGWSLGRRRATLKIFACHGSLEIAGCGMLVIIVLGLDKGLQFLANLLCLAIKGA